MKYIFSFLVLSILAVFAGVGYLYHSIRFDAYKIIDYKPEISSQIYDRNGKLVANIFDNHFRIYVPYEEIPSRVIEALVAIEDTSYFEHKGINPEAIFRAIIKDIKAMKLVEGASTITQQLIKNVALTREKTIIRKLKEAVLAFRVEVKLSKEEILERYFNEVYFGHGYYGIKTAAKGYFHKDLSALSLKEMAMLVGLPKAPSSYDPTRHLNLSLSRANNVVERMERLGWISKAEYKKALDEQPLIYDESLTQNRAPYVVDQVLRETSKEFKNIKSGGYKIHLGLDLRLQEMAKESLRKGQKDILRLVSKQSKKIDDVNESNDTKLNGAMVVMEAKNGDILALVGGVDYKTSSFNRAVQSRRQPGSSIKPFIYQIALDLGYSPMSKIADISRVYEDKINNKIWKPKNYGGSFNGLVTLKNAITHSRNLATINLVNSIGLDVLHEKMTQIGFENVPMDLSISLGSFGISPLQFAFFYSAFPNGGEMIKPRLITHIEDRFGNENIYEVQKRVFTTPEQAYLMVDMMKSVVQNGSGRAAKMRDIEVAGKTGTTNDNIDAWFCGYTPDIEVLTWYGRDDNKPIGKKITGSKVAPVFKDFVSKYLTIYPQTTREFEKPKDVSIRNIKGVDVLFTKTSPLPKSSVSKSFQNANELLF